jgi:hypothetical protein
MSEQRYRGACLCGSVQFEAAGPATNLCYCYCHSCRRASGAPLVAWGTFARNGFRITRGTLTEYRSSPPVVRGLCAACGGALTYRHQSRPEEIDVTLASLEEAARLVPQMHVWVSDKLPWVSISDQLPQLARGTAEPAC